ncbi:MAG TPA: ABC transporter ATP-binding protein [Polyangiaceae bacterium]
MSTEAKQKDREVVRRYAAQPDRLPLAVRQALEQRGPQAVEAYALIDLDRDLRLAEGWLALTPVDLVYFPPGGPARTLERARVENVEVESGLSCNTLRVQVPGDEPFALHFTQRQRLAVENVAERLKQRAADAGQASTVKPSAQNDNADADYASYVAQPIRDAQALIASRSGSVLLRLLTYLRPYGRQVAVGLSAAAVITVLALVPPLLTGFLIDRVIRPAQASGVRLEHVPLVAWLVVAALAAVYALRRAAAFLRLRSMALIGENVARDLRSELYDHLQRLSMAFFSRKKTGSLITRVSSDTDRLWEFLALGVVDVSLAVVMLVGLSVVLISLDPALGLMMTVPLPIVCWGIYLHSHRMEQLFLRAFRKWSRVTDVLGDTIPGMKVVRAFDQHTRESARFDACNRAATEEFNRIHHVWTSFWPALTFCVEVAIVAVWGLALPRLFEHGSGLTAPLSLGTFVSFLLYTTMFMAPIEILGQVARVMNRATTSAHRVFQVLDTAPDVADAPDAARIAVHGRVTFERVSFSYDSVRPALSNMSFDVSPGEMIGLVGPSGGGKTTIVNLLARFYDVNSGRVLIDGVDVRKLSSGHLRRQIGMVLQDPFLFHGSVLENVRYGAPDARHADVVRAAKVANAHDFICRLPHGYDTVVGERGHTLSGGERQRLSIARAVLADPRILILDEATSAVDTETERKIQEAMDRLVKGRTVFAIAHRLSTLHRASRLFVIEKGRLLEAGTHEELVADSASTYRRLYELQIQLHTSTR